MALELVGFQIGFPTKVLIPHESLLRPPAARLPVSVFPSSSDLILLKGDVSRRLSLTFGLIFYHFKGLVITGGVIWYIFTTT